MLREVCRQEIWLRSRLPWKSATSEFARTSVHTNLRVCLTSPMATSCTRTPSSWIFMGGNLLQMMLIWPRAIEANTIISFSTCLFWRKQKICTSSWHCDHALATIPFYCVYMCTMSRFCYVFRCCEHASWHILSVASNTIAHNNKWRNGGRHFLFMSQGDTSLLHEPCSYAICHESLFKAQKIYKLWLITLCKWQVCLMSA